MRQRFSAAAVAEQVASLTVNDQEGWARRILWGLTPAQRVEVDRLLPGAITVATRRELHP